MKDIFNEDLEFKKVPENDDMFGANKFAHSISCYLNTFENTALISKNVKDKIKENCTERLSLTEIRISLFFYFRAIRHGGSEPNSLIVNQHLNLIRDRIREQTIENQFNSITTKAIIKSINSSIYNKIHSLKPMEVIKTENKGSQTIILKGENGDYENLIEFWLSCQAWYSDGYDTSFRVLIFDNLSKYDFVKLDANRLGACKEINQTKLETIKQKINYFDDSIRVKYSSEMDSNWDNHKVLFSDGINYYLYFFWTGN